MPTPRPCRPPLSFRVRYSAAEILAAHAERIRQLDAIPPAERNAFWPRMRALAVRKIEIYRQRHRGAATRRRRAA